MENTKRIIEIDGVKLEVDMRTARKIDEFRIGDNVKVYKNDAVHAGVITEFVNFKELPTIIIAIFKEDYWSGTSIEFVYYNKQLSEKIDIVPCAEHELKLNKSRIIDKFNQNIEKKRSELEEVIAKKEYFTKYFEKHFEKEKGVFDV